MGKGHRQCAICGIQEMRHTEKEIHFFKFPLDPARCRKWLKAVGNEELVHLPIEKLHDLRHICSNHFGKKDFSKKGNFLKRYAVPTLNLKALPLVDSHFAEFPRHIHPHRLKGSSLEATEQKENIQDVQFEEPMDLEENSNHSPDLIQPIHSAHIFECWRHKLKTVFNSEKFCGFCMENNKEMLPVHECLEIRVKEWSLNKSGREIIKEVFQDQDVLLSNYICEKCSEKLYQAYLFIHTTKCVAQIMNNYANDLHSKMVLLTSHLSEDPKDHSNVVIILENDSAGDFDPEILDPDKRIYYDAKLNCDDQNHDEDNKENESQMKGADNINKKFECPFCTKSFTTNEQLIAHHKVHSKVDCKFCPMIISESDLVDHLRKNHENSFFLCEYCNTPHYTEKDLDNHLKSSHPFKHDELKRECVMCLKDFIPARLKTHTCQFRCPECSEIPCIHYKYLKSYKDQVLRQVEKTRCIDCDYVCRNKEILLCHVNREHLNRHPYICDKCGQQFHGKQLLSLHIIKFHHETFICEFCDNEFPDMPKLERHKKVCQSVVNVYACQECPATFKIKQKLAAHKKLRHSIEVISCVMCNKTFATEPRKKLHMFKVHGGLQLKRTLKSSGVNFEEPKENHSAVSSKNSTNPIEELKASNSTPKITTESSQES